MRRDDDFPTPRTSRALAPARFAVLTLAIAGLVALVTGIPTDLVPNGWFTRMTSIQGYAYPVWAASALMSGALAVSYLAGPGRPTRASKASGGGTLGMAFLAVGCPVCNELVVATLGFSGALTYFAPVQPLLAVASLAGLALMLVLRARRLRTRAGSCSTGIEVAPRTQSTG